MRVFHQNESFFIKMRVFHQNESCLHALSFRRKFNTFSWGTLYQPWNCSFLFCGIYLFIIQGVEKTSWTTYYKFWRAHSQSCSKKHWQHFTNRKLSTQILLLCLPLVSPASVYQAEGGLAFWWQLNLKLFRGHQQNLPLKISYWWKGKKSTISSSPHHFQCSKFKKLKKAKNRIL